MAGILYTVKSKGETPATIAKKYEVDAAKCAVVNNFGEDAEIPAGTSVFVPDAQLDWATRQEINGDLFKSLSATDIIFHLTTDGATLHSIQESVLSTVVLIWLVQREHQFILLWTEL